MTMHSKRFYFSQFTGEPELGLTAKDKAILAAKKLARDANNGGCPTDIDKYDTYVEVTWDTGWSDGGGY